VITEHYRYSLQFLVPLSFSNSLAHTRKYEVASIVCTTTTPKGVVPLFALLGIPSAAHLPRSPFQLIELFEHVRTDCLIIPIPSRVMAITVNVYFPGLTIVINNHSVQVRGS